MKKVQVLILFILFTAASPLLAVKNCECGSQQSGSVTTYSVGDGQGCCSGLASTFGMYITYTPDEGNTYAVTSQTTISGSTAQNGCCPHG